MFSIKLTQIDNDGNVEGERILGPFHNIQFDHKSVIADKNEVVTYEDHLWTAQEPYRGDDGDEFEVFGAEMMEIVPALAQELLTLQVVNQCNGPLNWTNLLVKQPIDRIGLELANRALYRDKRADPSKYRILDPDSSVPRSDPFSISFF